MSTIITLADEFELWTLKNTAATFLPQKKTVREVWITVISV